MLAYNRISLHIHDFIVYALVTFTLLLNSQKLTDNSNADYAVTQSLVGTDHDQPESPTDVTQGYSKLDSEVNDDGKST